LSTALSAAAILVIGGCGGSNNSNQKVDAGLQATARGVMPSLAKAEPAYITAPDFRLAYQAYVDHARSLVDEEATRLASKRQFIQVLIVDPQTFPPQNALLVPGVRDPGVYIGQDLLARVLSKEQPIFTTLENSGKTVRGYLTPLQVPWILKPRALKGVLEVFQVTSP
jgi:hypothetical protein